MWYVFMFAGLAILCVVVVLIRNAQVKARRSTEETRGHAPSHAEEDRARNERKRRRAQSKADRRKRH
jgi:septal ring-binding cell division protein DamX